MADSKATYPSVVAERFQIRLPEGLRNQIKDAAAENGRSMNSEILARLFGDAEALRDRFAGHALIGMGTWMPAGFVNLNTDEAAKSRAEFAYRQADAMLAARKGDA